MSNSIETLKTVRMRLEVAQRLLEMASPSSIRSALKKIEEAINDIDGNPASSHAKFAVEMRSVSVTRRCM